MARGPIPKIPIYINGTRNAIAPFDAGPGQLAVAMAHLSTDDRGVVLLNASRSVAPGRFVDLDLAIPLDQIETLVELLRARAKEAGELFGA